MKKCISLILALALVLSLGSIAFADQEQEKNVQIIQDEYGTTRLTYVKDDEYERITTTDREGADYIIKVTLNKETGDTYVEEIPKTDGLDIKSYTVSGDELNAPMTDNASLFPWTETEEVDGLGGRYFYVYSAINISLFMQMFF